MLKLGNETYTFEEVDLITTYEEVYGVPEEEKITQWWGDLGFHEFKHNAEPEKAKERLEKSLKAIRMTRDEYKDFRYSYRSKVIDMMKKYMPPKYEAVIIFNKPMLFTNERLEDFDVPEGMHRYDIRDGGMDGIMCEIKDEVAVNHWGTVMSRDTVEPRIIDGKEMNTQEGIAMTEDDYNYTGEEFTAEEYLEKYEYLQNEYCEPEETQGLTMQ